jgi:hypothetical protein
MDVHIFTEFQQAHNAIDRAVIGCVVSEFRIPGIRLRLVELTTQNTLACVKIQTELENFFEL